MLMSPEHDHVALPSLRQLGRRAIPQILEGAVVPAILFLATRQVAGLVAAIAVALSWSVGAITVRKMRGQRIPGMVVLGAVTLLVRSALGAVTGSAFWYFLQPSIGTIGLASAFIVSVSFDRPLVRKFAGDFCALPSHVERDVRVHRFFRHCSLMWGVVGLFNAALTIWLLLTQGTVAFVVLKNVASVGATVMCVVLSFVWFRRMMTKQGFVIAAA
jgi:intracellular septation protein A